MDVLTSQESGLLSVTLTVVILISAVWIFATRGRRRTLKLPPGPPGWPIVGNAPEVVLRHPGSSNDDYYFSRWSREYGGIYKLGLGPQMMYVLSNVDMVREVFTHSDVQGRPRAVAFEMAFGPRAKGVFFATGAGWTVTKLFVKNLFRDLGVGRGIFAGAIQLEIGRCLKKLDASTDEPFWGTQELFGAALNNIMCGVTFGKQYDYDDAEFKEIVHIKESLVRAVGPSGVGLTSRLLCGLPFGPGRSTMDCLRQFKTYMQNRIRETTSSSLEAEESPNSLVKAFMVKTGSGEEHFDEENLVAWCLDLFSAGTVTTTAALSYAILYLTVHPGVQNRCRQELDDFVDVHGALPSFSARHKLPYLQATILETERLATPAVLGAPHVVESEGLQMFGYDFPKGTLVVANYCAMNMDPERFPEPGNFDPERFLDSDGNFVNDRDIISFSVGRRACLGEPLARMVVFLFLVSLLRRYTFTAPEDIEMPDFRKGVYGVSRIPLPYAVVVKKRGMDWSSCEDLSH